MNIIGQSVLLCIGLLWRQPFFLFGKCVCVFRNDRDAKPDCFHFRVAPTALGHTHRGERQKLMVNSWEEMSVRVQKGNFIANSRLHYNFQINVLFEAVY